MGDRQRRGAVEQAVQMVVQAEDDSVAAAQGLVQPGAIQETAVGGRDTGLVGFDQFIVQIDFAGHRFTHRSQNSKRG